MKKWDSEGLLKNIIIQSNISKCLMPDWAERGSEQAASSVSGQHFPEKLCCFVVPMSFAVLL